MKIDEIILTVKQFTKQIENEQFVSALRNFTNELKFNPNHVPSGERGGQFTSGSAGTIEEAESYAIENGLAQSVNYKGLKNVEIANETNRTLLELKKQGIAYDKITSIRKVSDKNGNPAFMLSNETLLTRDENGAITKEYHTLVLNKAFFDKNQSLEDVNGYAKGLRNKNWATVETYKDMVNHEIGHRLTIKNINSNLSLANSETIIDDSRLGRYSQKKIDERLAEIYAFYKKTGDAPTEWKQLFNKWSTIKI